MAVLGRMLVMPLSPLRKYLPLQVNRRRQAAEGDTPDQGAVSDFAEYASRTAGVVSLRQVGGFVQLVRFAAHPPQPAEPTAVHLRACWRSSGRSWRATVSIPSA